MNNLSIISLTLLVVMGCNTSKDDLVKEKHIEVVGEKIDLERKVATYTVYTTANKYSDKDFLLNFSDSLTKGMNYVAIGFFDIKEKTPKVSDHYTIPLNEQEHLFAILRPEYPENLNYKLIYTNYGNKVNEE